MISETEAILNAHLTAAEDERDELRSAANGAILDALAVMPPDIAKRFMEFPTYKRLAAALNQPGASYAKHLEGQPADAQDRHKAPIDRKGAA
jgi:hypothetical protein